MIDATLEFDERWYLEANPDVRVAVESGAFGSGLEHYRRHGEREGRFPNAGTSAKPIVHLHIPKTAGTSVRGALERLGKRILRIDGFVTDFDPTQSQGIEVYSGHFGYKTASAIGGDIVTILREPVDRFLSFYYFLRERHARNEEVSQRTIIASKYSLEEFTDLLDCDHFIAELSNLMVWQLAHSYRLAHRNEFRARHAPTDDELLAIAVRNIESFAIVGFQDDMGGFLDAFQSKLGLRLDLQREYATEERPSANELPAAIRRKILRWTYLDHELYAHVRAAHCKPLEVVSPTHGSPA